MPRVLRIINRFNLGGPTYNAAYLTKHLAPEFETMLVGGMKDDSEDSSEFIVENLGVDARVLSSMRRSIHPLRDRVAYNEIKNIIRDFRPDIVHTHASKAGALGRRAAHQLGVPAIVHTFHGHVFHSYFGRFKSGFYRSLERYLASRSDRIIAISEKQKEELVREHRICDPGKVAVIPLGFDLQRFREDREEKRRRFRREYGLEEGEVAIGIVGRLVPVKNHELFLRGVAALLGRSSQKVRAFIIGDGEEREDLLLKAKNMGIPVALGWEGKRAPLTFTSWIKNVDEVYAGLDIVALTSLNEGTPVSLIEAQAAGVPIVSTRVGGVENVVVPGETALLCSRTDPQEFSEKLLRLVDDPGKRFEMTEKGWPYVKDRFSVERLVKDMGDLYREMIDQAGRNKGHGSMQGVESPGI